MHCKKVELAWTRPRKRGNTNVCDFDTSSEGELFKEAPGVVKQKGGGRNER